VCCSSQCPVSGFGRRNLKVGQNSKIQRTAATLTSSFWSNEPLNVGEEITKDNFRGFVFDLEPIVQDVLDETSSVSVTKRESRARIK
jgi:hypothetical protein